MKKYTEQEIINKVKELWAEDDGEWSKFKVEVEITKSKVDITLSRQCDSPGLSFAHLKALSEFFETDSINDDDRFSSSGCESCDYGSKYGFTITIRPDKG